MPKDPEIVILFDQYGNLTPEGMERYLSGKLSEKERAAVEHHLAGSPFEREALEGLNKHQKENLRNDLLELDAKVLAKARERAIAPPPRSLRPYYWTAAAGLTALVGLTVLLFYMFQGPSDAQLAVGQLAVDSAEPETTETTETIGTTGTIGTIETTGTIGTTGTLVQPSDKVVLADDQDVPASEQNIIEDAFIISEEPEAVEAFAVADPREDTIKEEGAIFLVVESMPEFPGGEDAFNKYLSDSLHYPAAAIEQAIQGRVFVTFVVEKDGSVTNARILRGIGGGCDEEALRVIRNMPKWTPGKQRGLPVRVQYNMPIKFTLEGR